MILQDILFRNVETCAVKVMYFKGENITEFVSDKFYLFEKDGFSLAHAWKLPPYPH